MQYLCVFVGFTVLVLTLGCVSGENNTQACPGGYYNVNKENHCPPCPVDTYKESNVSCMPCPGRRRTWGRKAVNNSQYCTDENPIKIPQQIKIHQVVRPGTVIVNFTATYDNNSLVIPPLVYSIASITRHYIPNSRSNSRSESTLDYFDSCQQLGNQSYPFCIFKNNGSILVSSNFTCIDAETFVIRINVTDSADDSKGKIWNSNGSVVINCTSDPCEFPRKTYDKAKALCTSTPQAKTYNFSNNNNSKTMDVKIDLQAYKIYKITLSKGSDKELNQCMLSMRDMNDRTYLLTSSLNFSKNETVKELPLAPPLQLEARTITLSLKCNDNNTLSYINQVTITAKRHENCVDINKTCLQALYKWKNGYHNNACLQDTSKLLDYYGRCIEPAGITLSREIRVPSSVGKVKIHCNVTSPLPVNIKWFKDNKEHLSNGSMLTLQASPTNQVRYTCKVNSILGEWRKQVLFVLTDYFTSYVQMKFKKMIDDCSKKCKSIADSLRSGNYTVGRYSKCPSSGNDRTVECTFYGKKNRQTIQEYYDQLETNLRALPPTLGLQKNSIVVRDAESCLRESEGHTNIQGIFVSNSTKIVPRVLEIPCPYGPRGNVARRQCEGNFADGATWSSIDTRDCAFKSKITEALNNLNNTKVTSDNAKQVANDMTKIFSKGSSKNLTGDHASMAANVLENIVSVSGRLNETAGLALEVIDVIMEMNGSVLANSTQATSKIINVLDTIAENIPIQDGKSSIALTTGNLVLQANNVDKTTFKGLSFGIKEDGNIASSPDNSVTSVELPTSVLQKAGNRSARVGFIHYANNKLFQSKLEGNTTKLSNSIISSSVYSIDTTSLTSPVKLTVPRLKGQDVESLRNSSCVYWNESGRTWLRDGCSLCSTQDSSKDTVQCCCNHLTNFAVLFSPQPVVTPKEKTIHTKVLTIITYVGCGISFIGVILTFLTYLLFRHLRKTNQQPILMNMCVAICLLLVVFVSGINSTGNTLGCQIVAVLLHYLTLVTVLWMGIEAYNLYLQIVKVMAIYQRKFMLKAALVGWGVPLVIVLATLSAAIVQYKQSDGSMEFYYGNRDVCVLHNHLYRIIGWFSPILVILVLNLVMFFVVVHKLQCTGAMVPVETKSTQRKRCWTALAIMCLLGLTWLFGALAISDARIAFEYLFCIFNSLQGFFIFFFHCVRIPEVRKQWSFFVSGLGFSHKGSEQSQPRSRGIGESQNHSQTAGKVRPKSWTPKDEGEMPRKGTVLTTVGDSSSQNGDTCKDIKKENGKNNKKENGKNIHKENGKNIHKENGKNIKKENGKNIKKENIELDKVNSYNNYGCAKEP